ncbi:MAG: hypothetical protein AABW79_04415 [Nanoarchaeota archaeon]
MVAISKENERWVLKAVRDLSEFSGLMMQAVNLPQKGVTMRSGNTHYFSPYDIYRHGNNIKFEDLDEIFIAPHASNVPDVLESLIKKGNVDKIYAGGYPYYRACIRNKSSNKP